ncbi:MAG TPA: DUF4325 domain-containing protein [Myxococcales bacterium LLY-WYZ-16_1]|nr:DUF4325 domain-containing protein [Myxococcales bacterium LLY-WYZ-16_1]
MKLDDTDKGILACLGRTEELSATRLAQEVGLSRQAVQARLKRLVDSGQVVRTGRARATRYSLASLEWSRRFPLRGLEEHKVHDCLEAEFEPLRSLDVKASRLVHYALTEMVNNAIDHSDGSTVLVKVEMRHRKLLLEVQDDGVGVYAKVREHLKLADELEALQEISKGKTTTDPERHSGEGIFFTSKCVTHFRLESGRTRWWVDNERSDMTVQSLDPPRGGTRVVMEIDLNAPIDVRQVFEAYTEGFDFVKTRTVVKLFAAGTSFVSRSQAKRLMEGLERFEEIVLDFAGVEFVGQGFADEVFRVWAHAHPDHRVLAENMNDEVEFIVRRAAPKERVD